MPTKPDTEIGFRHLDASYLKQIPHPNITIMLFIELVDFCLIYLKFNDV